MKKFLVLCLSLLLTVVVTGIGAQESEMMDDTVIRDYLENFDQNLLADDVSIYDEAYNVSYNNPDDFESDAIFFQDWFEEAEVAIENVSNVVDNQFRATFDVGLPDLEEPAAMEAIFHVNDEGQIDDRF